VYLPNYEVFAVPVTFVTTSAGTYTNRGIFTTELVDVPAMDGSIFQDQRTILDIRESEFSSIPAQRDHVIIPRDCNGVNQGEWEIIDSWTNGGGETTFVLRKWTP
jgi:hypothetical protein